MMRGVTRAFRFQQSFTETAPASNQAVAAGTLLSPASTSPFPFLSAPRCLWQGTAVLAAAGGMQASRTFLSTQGILHVPCSAASSRAKSWSLLGDFSNTFGTRLSVPKTLT